MLENQHSGKPGSIQMLDFQHENVPSFLPSAPATASFRRVDLSTYLRMDPHLLLGLLNTELRNHCDSLDDLVKTHGLDAGKLVEKMTKAGYDYLPAQNQFR
jgi:hypothetical protein